MAEISERITNFLRRFGDSVVDLRFEDAVAEHFLPLPIIRPHDTVLLSTREEIVEDLAAFWHTWQAAGVFSVTPTIIGLRSFAYGVYLADIEWAFRDRQGAEVALVHTSYGFRQDGDAFGISAVFGHDEILQRPILEAASSL